MIGLIVEEAYPTQFKALLFRLGRHQVARGGQYRWLVERRISLRGGIEVRQPVMGVPELVRHR